MKVATDAELRVLKCPTGKKSIEASIENSPGLRIRVTPGGRTWRYDSRFTGKRSLGAYPAISLAEAKRAAASIRAGIEPEKVRDRWAELDMKVLAVAERRTLGDAVAAYQAAQGFAVRSWPAQLRSIRLRYGDLFDRPLPALRQDDVLDPFRRDQNVAASRASTHLQIVLRRAKRADLAAPRADLAAMVPKRPRERVLSADELRAIWRALPELREPWPAAIPALIYCMQRKSDLLHMRWAHVDLDAAEWRARIRKTRGGTRTELLPLSRQIVELIRSRQRESEFAFATSAGRPFSTSTHPIMQRLWNAPNEVVHPPGYDHPVFRWTRGWQANETSPKRSC